MTDGHNAESEEVRALAERLINLRIPNPLVAGSEHDIEASGIYDWHELQRLASAILSVTTPEVPLQER